MLWIQTGMRGPMAPQPLSYTLMAFWRFPLSKRDSKSSVVSWGPSKGAAGEESGPGAPPTRAQVKQEPWSTVGGIRDSGGGLGRVEALRGAACAPLPGLEW